MQLTHDQQLAISLLAKSPLAEQFYWTGGTLLAYHYLQHRKSEDLDFFTSLPFSFDQVNEFIQNLKTKGNFTKVKYHKIFDRHEFLLENIEPLRIEFVYYNHDKKTLAERKKLLGIMIDSLTDLATNKTMAYFDRTEPKDLVDIYFLLTKKDFTPGKLLELVEKKFGVQFTENTFWSESFKTLSLLKNIKPLLIGTEDEQNLMIQQIEDYFKRGSKNLLIKELT